MKEPTATDQSPSTSENKVFCCNILQCRCGHCRIPQRAIMAFMQHFLLQACYNARMVLNVAIVEMVEPEPQAQNSSHACPNLPDPVHYSSSDITYPWPRQVKSLILYSFFIGYTAAQIPGGWLADKFGARWVQGICLLITVAVTAVFPVTIGYLGYNGAIVLRFILGLAHGPSVPCSSSLISTWVPPSERPIWGGIAFSGSNLGVIVGSVLTGVIIQAYDWRMAFYIWAVYCAVFFVLAMCYVYSFPDTHPNVDPKEVEYIKKTIATQAPHLTRRPLSTPWLKIMTNGPYVANIFANFSHHYIYFCFVTYFPTYLSEILKYEVSGVGYITALPYVVLWISVLTFSFSAGFVQKYIRQNTFDIIFGAGGNCATAVLMLVAKYVGCNRTTAIAIFCLSMFFKAFYYVTIATNINALSHNYGGILCGISLGISSLSGIIGNPIIGAITKQGSIDEWITTDWICVGQAVFTSIVFCWFSSDKRQDFDKMEGEDD